MMGAAQTVRRKTGVVSEILILTCTPLVNHLNLLSSILFQKHIALFYDKKR